MTIDTWYLFFAAISGIGALWMRRGKKLDKAERQGALIIFSGFALQTVWWVWKNDWKPSAIILLGVFVLFSVIVNYGFKGKRLTIRKG